DILGPCCVSSPPDKIVPALESKKVNWCGVDITGSSSFYSKQVHISRTQTETSQDPNAFIHHSFDWSGFQKVFGPVFAHHCYFRKHMRFWSRGNRYHCRNWDEIAAVIRFNLVCPHAINSPNARSGTSRYGVIRSKPFLPVEDNNGIVTFRSGKADIEKCSV